MAKLKLSNDYYAVLADMARCAIQDRVALIDAHYTSEARFFENGATYPDAVAAHASYTEVKSDVEPQIADFEVIQKYALSKIRSVQGVL